MTSKLSKFILFVLLLSGVCTGTTYSQICAYSVSGQVTDPVTHLPVTGAPVGLYRSGFSDTVFTDAGGNYNYSYYEACDSMNVYLFTQLLGCPGTGDWLNIPAGDTVHRSFETCIPEPPDTSCSVLLSAARTSGNTISYSWSGNSSPVASVVSVIWSFGDGQTQNGGNSGTYTYSTHGSYTPCVNVTWSNGCVANDCRPVLIPPPYTSCTYKFSGYVKGVGGQAIANSPVSVTLPSAPGYTGGTHVVYTNANGYYNISSGMPCDLTDSVTIATSGCGSSFSETVPLQTGVRNYTQNFYTCQDSCHITADVYEVRPGTVYANWNGGNSNGAPVESTVWTLGNGNTWNWRSGYHGYAPGTYTLCATVTWAGGCVATDCQTVTVGDSTENQCVFEITGQVTDPQTGQPAVNEAVEVWNNGIGTLVISTDSNGVYSFTRLFSCDSLQRFWVRVLNCDSTTYQYVEAAPGQPYNLPLTTCGSDSSNCGGTVNVTSIQQGIALSYNVPGANDFIVTFGDGTGTFFSPTQHVYADSGVYEVCVHAYVSNTCSFDTCFTVSIDRATASDSCYVQAMLTPYGTNGVEFGWTGHNTLGLNPVSVTWDFGDGDSSYTTNGGIHYYDRAGTYTACVTLTWGTGCVATDCQNVIVSDSAANQCVFEISGQVTDPQTGQPAANESVEVWNNGTGVLVISTDSNGVYSFTRLFSCDSLQRFWVRVRNCGNAGYHYAEVLPGQPYNLPLTSCGPGSPDTCRAQALLTPYGANGAEFDWNGYNSYGLNPISAAWDFGDGHSTTDSDGIHYYDQPGTYTACVTLTWGTGCVATDCRNVTVNPVGVCDVDAVVSVSGSDIRYTWYGNAPDSNATVTSVVWNMGNGYITNNYPDSGSYTYPVAGNYTVCVTVSWSNGCESTDCRNIQVGVTPPAPLCGFVFYSDDSLAASCTHVYLMNMDSNGVHTVADTYTSVDGYYCFYSQPAGTYTVLAIPCDSLTIAENLLPTYLGNVLYWQNALQTSANPLPAIRLIDGQQTQGPGGISGIVVWGDDKAPGDPAVGIRVLLLDGEGNPIGYSVTNAEGFYSFAHLPLGTYRIYPEAAGYTTYPILVTLTAENPEAENLNFGVGFNVFMGIQEAPVSVKGLYPNPASEMTTLSFSSKQSGAGELRITDLSGKTVLSQTVSVIQGTQNIPVTLPQIGAGMYTLTLTLNGQQTHVKLIKQ